MRMSYPSAPNERGNPHHKKPSPEHSEFALQETALGNFTCKRSRLLRYVKRVTANDLIFEVAVPYRGEEFQADQEIQNLFNR